MSIETKFLINLPISKVNHDERTVEGYATTEDIDKQNEMVDYGASKEAFKDWTGNIREMHEPKAVGKAVSWEPDDDRRAIKVKAYISKGAPETWEKIKDGTLKAFSIGGQTVNKVQQIIKDDTGGQKHVTKITKYRLTELSLVDNPANPAATFELVKMSDGVPMQTAVVEDMKKVIMSQASDILEDEVKEHRTKADSLVKKVLSTEELDKLDSEQWGVIRKYEKDGSQVIERILPMPDKVHAVRALAVIDSYSLTKDEQDRVHDIAKSILGSDYETYAINTTKGGEIKKMNKEILEAVKGLTKRIEAIETKVLKANMETTSNLKTQEDVDRGVPDNSAPEKKGNYEGKVPKEGEKQELSDVDAADKNEKPVKTQEEGNVAPKKKPDTEAKGDYEGKVPAEGEKQELPDVKAKDATEKPIKTQEEGNVAPVHKADDKKEIKMEAKDKKKKLKEGSDEEEAEESKEEEAAEDMPVKKVKKSLETKEEDIEKSTNQLILAELKSLSKRLDAIESTPLPRKYRPIEKKFGAAENTPSDGLAENMNKCLELRKAEQNGRTLTADERMFIKKTLDQSIETKFGKNL